MSITLCLAEKTDRKIQYVLQICLNILLVGVRVNGCFRAQEFRFHGCNYVHNKVCPSVYSSSNFKTKKSENVDAK
jgi:hypothetical protein